MDSDVPSSSEPSILDLQEQERIEKKKKQLRNYQKQRRQIPVIKERENLKKQSKRLLSALSQFGKNDPHKICKELGHSRAHGRRNPNYFYRCSTCDVSFSDKEKTYFYNGSYCPCCHTKLRIRKTVTQKKKLNSAFT
jgi:hypothetical protein